MNLLRNEYLKNRTTEVSKTAFRFSGLSSDTKKKAKFGNVRFVHVSRGTQSKVKMLKNVVTYFIITLNRLLLQDLAIFNPMWKAFGAVQRGFRMLK